MIRTRRVFGCAVLGLLALGPVACALPVPWSCEGARCELVLGYASQDPADGRYRRVVAGLDVRRGWLTQGATLGWSDLRLLRAREAASKPAADAKSAGVGAGLPFFLRWWGDGSTEHRLGLFFLGAPELERAFVHHIRLGASVMAGPHDSGVEAGASSVTHLAVPLDEEDDGVYWLRYRARDFGSSSYERQATKGGSTP